MVEYEKVMREEKETGKEKGLLERLFGKRWKRSSSKLERSEDNPSSESCAELEAKTFIESGNTFSQSPLIASKITVMKNKAACIPEKILEVFVIQTQ